MNEEESYQPRPSVINVESVETKSPIANASKGKKEVDKRPNPIERYLDKFKFTNKKHIVWLKDEATFYQVRYEAYSQLQDSDFRFCEEMADWLKSAEGQKELDEIRQKWAKFSSSKKTNYSVAMPKLIYGHLNELAKKSNTSMNTIVFNLIERAYDDLKHDSSFEEDVRKRFDELKKLILGTHQSNAVNTSPVPIKEQVGTSSLEERIISLTKELEEAKDKTDLNIRVKAIGALSSTAQSFKSLQEKRNKPRS
ncbi:MAG: hypothetical protein ACK5NC_04005 [Vibrio sp.]